mgnify:FL=1
MNLKENLIKLKEMLKKTTQEDKYVELLKETIDSTELTNEQFEFLKNLYLKNNQTIGLHNTYLRDINSFFSKGLYNYKDFNYEQSQSLTNTIAPTLTFRGALLYHHPNYVTIILSLPDEVITGNRGILEPLKDGKWGFPPEYIVGAFYDGKIFLNKNYNEHYENKNATPIDDPITDSFKTREQKIEEVKLCEKLFYNQQKNGRKK